MSLRPLWIFHKKIPPTPSSYLLSKTSSVPLWANAMPETKQSLFWMASLNSDAGDKVFHELKESLVVLDLSYLSQRDKMTLLCIAFKAWPTMEDVFERIERGGGYFFVEKFKSGRRDQIFFLRWELFPNILGMQSLKALLLFIEEQCEFLPPLHHHRSCVLIPL